MSNGNPSPPSLPPEAEKAPPVAVPVASPYEKLIDERLRQTRRQVKSVDITSGLITLVAGSLIYLFAAALADHWLLTGGFGFWGRFLLWTILLAAAGTYFVVKIWPAIVYRINPIFAAETLEKSKPTLKNSLINFLLLRGRDHEVAPVVIHAMEQRAANDLKQVKVEVAVDRHNILRGGYVLIAVFVVFCLYMFISPKSPFISFGRILWPFSSVHAPTRVVIENVKPGNQESNVAFNGDTVLVTADVHGLKDGEPVQLHFSTADGQVIDQIVPMKRKPDGDRFESPLPPGTLGIQQDHTYYLSAGDAFTDKYQIEVLIPPSIAVERVTYHYPPYTGLPDRVVERQGDLRAIEGTRVTIRAEANQPIKEAFIVLSGKNPITRQIDAKEKTATAELDLELSKTEPGKSEFESYLLKFTDAKKRENKRPIRNQIDVFPDLAPEVALLEPEAEETTVAEDGKLEIKVRASDPDYALRRVAIEACREGHDAELLDIEPILDLKAPRPGKSGEFFGSYVFEPTKLKLKGGDRVEYWAVAEDNKEPKANQSTTTKKKFVIGSPKNPGGQNNQPRLAQKNPPPGKGQNDKPDNRQIEQGNRQPDEQNRQEDNRQPNPGQQKPENQANPDRNQNPEQNPDQKEANQEENQNSEQGENGEQGNQGEKAGKQQSQDGSKDGEKQNNQDNPQNGQDDQAGQGDQPQNKRVDPTAQAADAMRKIAEDAEKANQNKQEEQKDGEKGKQSDPQQQDAADKGNDSKQQENKPGEKGKDTKQQENKDGEKGNEQNRNNQNGGQGNDPQKDQNQADQKNGQNAAQPGNEQKQGNQKQPGQKNNPGDNAQQGNQPKGNEEKPSNSQPQKGNPGKDSPKGNAGGDNQASGDKPEGDNQQPGKEKTKNDKQNGKSGKQNRQGDDNPSGNNEQPGKENTPGNDKPKGNPKDQKQPGNEQKQGDETKPGESKQPGDKTSAKDGSKPENQNPNSDQKDPGKGNPDQKTPKPNEKDPGSKTTGPTNNPKGDPNKDAKTQGQPKAGPNPDSQTPNKPTNDKKPEGEGPKNDKKTDETKPPSIGDKPSKTEGGENGMQPGKGKDGGGTNRPQPGKDTPGSNTPSDDENGATSQEKGPGEVGKTPGRDAESKEPTGEQAKQKVDGPKQGKKQPGQDSPNGKPEPGDADGNTAGQNPPSGDPNKNKTSDSPRNEGSGPPTVGGKAAPSNAQERPPEEEPGGDPANLEYARKQSELALRHLEDEMGKDKSELLDKLGWTKEDAKKFVDRWEQLRRNAREPGEKGKEAKKELDDALKSLGLRPRSAKIDRGTTTRDREQNLRDKGRFTPPAEWADQFQEFQRSTPEKKK
jgi:hypothetical protein